MSLWGCFKDPGLLLSGQRSENGTNVEWGHIRREMWDGIRENFLSGFDFFLASEKDENVTGERTRLMDLESGYYGGI